MALPQLKDFSLVGGTALSLQYGHRISVDLDLFCTEGYEYYSLVESLKKEFGADFKHEEKESIFGIFCFINSIKVDIINYKHNPIDNLFTEDTIRMYSTKDIAAMKIQAILGRGRKKDFWDLAELLKHYTLEQIIDFYSAKFPSQQLLISVPQAITYFADAEESENPVSLKGQTWETVKKIIQQKVNDYLK
jgi:predicted nucleotidyltransferase component of viral defense system